MKVERERWRGWAMAASAVLLAWSLLPEYARAQAPAAEGRRTTQAAPRLIPIIPDMPRRPVARTPDRFLSVAEQYCRAVLDPAREARYAYQTAELQALSRALDARLAKIDARIAELKEWVARREDFAGRTTEQLVTIYSEMRAESASEQLAKIEENTAAAILSKLAPRVASQILNDMPAERAARLAMILMGASRKHDPEGGS